MSPLPYVAPWYASLRADSGQATLEVVNYRSLHLNMFEAANRYAVDLLWRGAGLLPVKGMLPTYVTKH